MSLCFHVMTAYLGLLPPLRPLDVLTDGCLICPFYVLTAVLMHLNVAARMSHSCRFRFRVLTACCLPYSLYAP